MTETPIIRLAAWIYADEHCGLPLKDPQHQSELEHFYKEHRKPNTDNWTRDYINRAVEAHAYMKEDGE